MVLGFSREKENKSLVTLNLGKNKFTNTFLHVLFKCLREKLWSFEKARIVALCCSNLPV